MFYTGAIVDVWEASITIYSKKKGLNNNFILIPRGSDRIGLSEDTMFYFICGRFVAPTSKISLIRNYESLIILYSYMISEHCTFQNIPP